MTEQLHLIAPPPPLDRLQALHRLQALVGVDLRPLAGRYRIHVGEGARRNKGWAGQVVEAYLGRSPNSDKGADFGTWELKVVPIARDARGGARLKESMAIASLNPVELELEGFDESHLLAKLERMVVVARYADDLDGDYSPVLGAFAFDLDDPVLYSRVRDDYEEIRWVVADMGPFALTGHIGQLIQPRPRGDGSTWGFYARPHFVAYMLGMRDTPD